MTGQITVPWSRLIAVALLTISTAACTDDPAVAPCDDPGGDCSPSEPPPECDPSADDDDDGLDNCRELELGTALHLPDSDGDGFSDYEEVVELGYSEENNRYKFNPRIADVPQIRVDITSAPTIELLAESTSGEERSYAVERSAESSARVTRSESSTQSHAVEWAVSVGGSVTVGTEFGFPTAKGKAEASVNWETSVATTQEVSMSWSEEQSRENKTGLKRAEETAASQSTTIRGGRLAVTLDVINQGDVAYTLKHLLLSSFMSTPRADMVLAPVGGLSFDTTFRSFPQLTYAPGQKNGPFIFKNDKLTLGTVSRLLNDSSNLDVRIVGYELTDENGRSFTHNQTQIAAKTANVLIDFGTARPIERYSVATNTNPDTLRVSLATVLDDILGVPYVLDGDGSLRSVRGFVHDDAASAYWAVAHKTTDGLQDTVALATSRGAGALELAALELKSGDVLHLVYIVDPDDDGLGDRQEAAYGTDPEDADTDDDGLSDSREVNETKSSPLEADTDGDGLSDGVEVDELGTSPLDADTDDDGLTDGREVDETGTSPLDADSDEDGLTDGREVDEVGSSPLDDDTDDDGLDDGAEVEEIGTSPLDADTDSDGLDDYREVNETGTVPVDADTDDDCLDDGEEVLGTRTSALEANPGLCQPGRRSVNLGWSGRQMRYRNISVAGQPRSVVRVAPGQSVRVATDWSLAVSGASYCPSCVVQFYVGVRGVFANCLISQVMGNGANGSGRLNKTFNAPQEPGIYYISEAHALQYECVNRGVGNDPNRAIGALIVSERAEPLSQ